MRRTVNIASARADTPEVTDEVLRRLEKGAGSVPVFLMPTSEDAWDRSRPPEPVGRTLGFEYRVPDLWAECELPDDFPLPEGLKAFGVIGRTVAGDWRLGAVVLTTLSRPEIVRLGHGVGGDRRG